MSRITTSSSKTLLWTFALAALSGTSRSSFSTAAYARRSHRSPAIGAARPAVGSPHAAVDPAAEADPRRLRRARTDRRRPALLRRHSYRRLVVLDDRPAAHRRDPR